VSGDTAKLLASLDLQDQMSPKLKGAIGNVAQAEGRVASLGTRLTSLATNLRTGVGGAIGTFGGRIKQLGIGLAAGLGVGGLLSVGGALKSGIEKAQSFGDEVRRLMALTGQGAADVSAMAAALEHFGVDADTAIRLTGFLEKNVGNLVARKDGVVKFETTFGISLRDANGHLKTANELLLTSADYFNNKNIPATTKAAALAKLYGRSWQELIPFLKAGREGIADAEAEAKSLGLTLTKDNVDALAKLKEATRSWGTALGGLELQIGLTLVPMLTDLAKAATAFVRDHRTDIVQFFKDAGTFAGNAARTIGSVAGSINSFWNSIPPGLRDLLIKGIVADRTVKFFFGISPIKLVASLAQDALGGVVKALGNTLVQQGLGKAFVQPVFVTNMGIGGLGGGAGGAAAAGGGFAAFALGTTAAAAALVAALIATQKLIVEPGLQREAGQNITDTQRVIATGDATKIRAALDGVKASVDSLSGLHKILYDLTADGVKVHTESLEAALSAALTNTRPGSPDDRQAAADAKAVQKKLDQSKDAMETMRIALASKAQATTSKVGDLQRTTSAGADDIVAAIQALKLNVNVDVHGDHISTGITGSTLNRTTTPTGPGHGL
jgi:hypothetical protein